MNQIATLTSMGPDSSDSVLALRVLRDRGVPVVAVSTGRAPEWALSVSVDDRKAAFEMTSHLGALGHRRIGFITGAPNQTSSDARLDGYQAALVDLALPLDETLITNGLYTYRSGLDAAEHLFDLAFPPTAIFAANDDMAAAAVAIAHHRGLDVPKDLTVCGFVDSALATTIWPELTTIRQPVTEMSRTAVDLLVRAIRARKSGRDDDLPVIQHITVDHTLIRRQSDAAPRRRPATSRDHIQH